MRSWAPRPRLSFQPVPDVPPFSPARSSSSPMTAAAGRASSTETAVGRFSSAPPATKSITPVMAMIVSGWTSPTPRFLPPRPSVCTAAPMRSALMHGELLGERVRTCSCTTRTPIYPASCAKPGMRCASLLTSSLTMSTQPPQARPHPCFYGSAHATVSSSSPSTSREASLHAPSPAQLLGRCARADGNRPSTESPRGFSPCLACHATIPCRALDDRGVGPVDEAGAGGRVTAHSVGRSCTAPTP